jgi:DNA-binding response OmpR family regulator
MNILVADDEADIRQLLRLELEERSYRVFEAKDGLEAVRIIRQEDIQLAVLDVMMPRLDGFSALREIRGTSSIPVIFLTARGEELDKLVGLGTGADDYIVKPFSAAELIARIEAQLRRRNIYDKSGVELPDTITWKSLKLDLKECMLYASGVPVPLHAKEYRMLECMMRHPNKIFTKKKLYAEVWGDDFYEDHNTVMVTMSRLRNKIEPDPRQPEFIITVRGLGYKFNMPGT